MSFWLLFSFIEYRQYSTHESKQTEGSRRKAWAVLCLLICRSLGGNRLKGKQKNGCTPFPYPTRLIMRNFTKFLFIIFSFFHAVEMKAYVDEYEDDLCIYRLYSDYTAKVIGTTITSLDEYNLKIPAYVRYGKNEYKVTEIGERVFYSKKKLKSVQLPNTLVEIGNEAFRECESITSVTMPDYKTSTLNKIGEEAFRDCKKLTSIDMPESVTEIGESAFYGCWKLSSIELPPSLKIIEYCLFHGCNSLTSIKIPNSVTNIGIGAFEGCGLKSVDIPNSVTNIGTGAFSGCAFTSISIPNSIKTISTWCFEGCKNLVSVDIPNTIKEIGTEAFSGCI